MIAKETERSIYVDVATIAWQPTQWPGIETKTLYRDPSGRQTTLTRFAPGARLPRHRHAGLEQSYVLEGTLVDDDGACSAGNFVWRRSGSVYDAWSPDGCVVLGVFEVPNEFGDQRAAARRVRSLIGRFGVAGRGRGSGGAVSRPVSTNP